MTEQELEAIRQRAEKATPGPWSMKQEGADFYMADSQGRYLDITLADAIFAAHSRQDIPALLDEVERLNEENARLTTELQRMTIERIADEHGWSAVESMMQADNVRLRAEIKLMRETVSTWEKNKSKGDEG